MAKRFDPERVVLDQRGYSVTSQMVESKFGGFVQFSDYEELRERLRSVLTWLKKMDPYTLDDISLSDFETDFEEAQDFLKGTYAQ